VTADRAAGTAGRAARVCERLGAPVALAPITLAGVAVDLWYAPVTALVERLGATAEPASDAERERADVCRAPEDRARYLATRRALRCVLHDYLDAPDPSGLCFLRGRYGKLSLDAEAHSRGVHFNLTHSGDLLLVAVSEGGAVGVDAEAPREFRDLDRLIRRMLTDGERAMLERAMAEGRTREDAFRRVWTVKEARIKALGLPVGAALSRALPEAEALPWVGVALPEWPDYFAAVALVPDAESAAIDATSHERAPRKDGSGPPTLGS
jgi:4'-phosphopantetheinyl transferase